MFENRPKDWNAKWKIAGESEPMDHGDLITALSKEEISIVGIVDGATNILLVRSGITQKISVLTTDEPIYVGRWVDPRIRLVPIQDFVWTDDYTWMRTLTCGNHPGAKYYTKNPYNRSTFFIKSSDSMPPFTECKCEGRMMVVCTREGIPVGKPANCVPITDEDVEGLPEDADDWKKWTVQQ